MIGPLFGLDGLESIPLVIGPLCGLDRLGPKSSSPPPWKGFAFKS